MSNNKTLSLGIIFSSTGIPKFNSEVSSLKKVLHGLDTDVGKLNKSLKGVTTGIKKTGTQARKTTTYIDKMGKSFTYFLSGGMLYKGLNQITMALTSGLSAMVGYSQALANLQAIAGATDTEVGLLGKTLVAVSNIQKFTTKMLADGLVLLSQAGFTAADSMRMIEDVGNLAAGTLSGLKETADLVTTAIRAFALETVESQRVVDVFANAVNKSKLTIAKLSTAFNFVGSAAKQSGLELEETTTSLGLLANAGARASTSATGLRQVLSRLAAPNKKLRAEFDLAGISINSLDLKTKSWREVLGSLSDVLVDSKTKTVDMEKAFRLFGLRGAQSIAVLVDSVSGANNKYDELYTKINAVGTAAKMSDIQMQGLGAQLERLGGVAQNTAIAFGEETGLTKAFQTFVIFATDALNVIQDLLKNGLVRVILQTALATTAVLGLAAAFKLLAGVMGVAKWAAASSAVMNVVGSVGTLRWALHGLWAVMAANPLVFIIAGVSALGFAFNHLSKSSERATKQLKEEIIELNGQSEDIKTWIKIVESATQSKEQQTAAMKRLGQQNKAFVQWLKDQGIAYKDLSLSIEDTLVKMKEFANFSMMETQKKEAKLYLDAIKKIRDESEKYSKHIENQTELQEYATEVVKSGKKEEEILLKNAVAGYIKYGKVMKMGQGQLEDHIKFLIKDRGESEKIIYVLKLKLKVLKEIEEAQKNAVKSAKKQNIEETEGFKLLTKAQQEYYKGLTGFDQLYFKQKFKLISESVDKTAESYKLSISYASLSAKDQEVIDKILLASKTKKYQADVKAYRKSLEEKGSSGKTAAEKLRDIENKLAVATVEDRKKADLKKAEIDAKSLAEEVKKLLKSGARRKAILKKIEEALGIEKLKIGEKYRSEELRLEEINNLKISDSLKNSFAKSKVLYNEYKSNVAAITEETTQDQIDALTDIVIDLDNKQQMSLELWEDYYKKLKVLRDKQIKEEKERNQDLITESGTVWENFTLGISKAADKAKSWNEQIQDIAEKSVGALSDYVSDFIVNLGEADQTFEEFAKNFLKMIAKMIIQQGILNALKAGFGTTATSPAPVSVSPGTTALAKGAMFYNGVKAFASGGFVDEPTYFTSKSGMNVAGEAGTEAIMPATRMPNGDLGVSAVGMGSTYNVNINVDGGKGGTNEENQSMAKAIAIAVEAKVKQIMVQEKRGGGMNAASSSRGGSFATI